MAKAKNRTPDVKTVLSALFASRDLSVVFFVMAILAIIIVPLPSGMLDFLLAVVIALSVLILLISLYIPKPTDLTTFPTLLLVITLFRLALNIATTRMILSHGHEGPEAVSDIVTSFGNFVVGGNMVIGVIVFTILVLINFMVITKGSGRVAEVAARFTLDAMPGKQMAIDADLNSGLIEESEAKRRRAEILQDANFYGAMDGSSKFIKGDAVAGIIITLINIIGGFLIGIFQFDLDVGASAQTYTILTIGDGLVSQVPALIISTATGIMITRGSSDTGGNFAEGSINQLMGNARVMIIVGFIMLLFAAVPGLPTFSLGFVGLIFAGLGYALYKYEKGDLVLTSAPLINKAGAPAAGASGTSEGGASSAPRKKSNEEIAKEEEAALEDILKIEMLELTLGYQLIRLADSAQGGDLLERIRSMRRKIASDFGFLMPQVRIRDNLHLKPTQYEILLKGVNIGDGLIQPDRYLAMDSGMAMGEIEGEPTKEPAFGLDALWIVPELKEDAIINGYTVVDPATVISTHMSELIKRHAEELLTRQETQALIEKIKNDYPVVVDDLLKVANIGLIQRVFKALLHERVPLKDMITILETMADVAEYTKSVDIITEHVRAKLSRIITQSYTSPDGVIKLLTFDTMSEQMMLEKSQERDGTRQLLLNVGEINGLIQATSLKATELLQKGISPIIVIVDPKLRRPLAEIYERFSLDIVTLSHAEIDSNAKFEVLGSITLDTK
ncbi:MAG: flagellar biosynthesis protein FlhA [Sulfuricurvum sp. GWF2_44_89]|uniref:Flagellar biosynthesis protein FlhA n=1 Tax=Sulfuricurvum kujiense TaxID=148813 RepID=A0A2D3WJS3_9BACT|nr:MULTISPECIES: flagellar biosynthesis protein FlhA [Sulfuricurvum]OHD78156.1 MAG: flagellar biosynthesis protein FlhA [Sulfuricurvum sp. GWF2_44_89]OHD91854.1 MAG: flagellar biosynthesis protein FlhA [Sulfuricurvum sp. RIFOXYD12_FULL_44_77]OHD95366.1 MAG: flagellar biosynthesis protein FlhA [Sulfuricurvum sp. RIFOXYD2_FULL_44_160]DAB37964.1 MAG TPA: flagellar biosynthesis protein FlhA [Sulfuricurvum kujiense]